MKRKILVDCDPGMDDALALLLLGSLVQLDTVAVTTSFGNDSCEETFENGKKIAALLGLNAVVARGAQGPVIEDRGNLRSHRPSLKVPKNFDGGQDVKDYEEHNQPGVFGWDVIYDAAVRAKGNLEIVTLGPLTNLAIALLKYEDLKDRIKTLTIMGGSAGVGNVTPFGEANVLLDPYAFQIVLQSGIGHMVLFGLDAAESLRLTEEEAAEIFSRRGSVSEAFLSLMEKGGGGAEKAVEVHAAATAAAAAFPELIKTEPLHAAVELGQNGQYGRTVIDCRLHATAEKNVNVVRAMDRDRFLDCFKNAWNYY